MSPPILEPSSLPVITFINLTLTSSKKNFFHLLLLNRKTKTLSENSVSLSNICIFILTLNSNTMAKHLATHFSIHTSREMLLHFCTSLLHFPSHHPSSLRDLIDCYRFKISFFICSCSFFTTKTPTVNPYQNILYP